MLDLYPHSPGEWFSDGVEMGASWGRIKGLVLPYSLSDGLLSRFTELPFWGRLEALEMRVSRGATEAFGLLHDRMPSNLRECRLSAMSAPLEPIPPGFWERLSAAPLRALELDLIDMPGDSLGQALSPAGRWRLDELSLRGHATDVWHAGVLAEAERARGLRRLILSGRRFGLDAVRALLAGAFPMLRRLQLPVADGVFGVLRKTASLERLRHLSLEGELPDLRQLEPLVASGKLTGLVSLQAFLPSLSAGLARLMCRLPHLAWLSLDARASDPDGRRVIESHAPLAWLNLLDADEDADHPAYRAHRAPERAPALHGMGFWDE